jgi:hypothetical protein
MENIIYFFTKQATLMRRSTVQILPLKLVFPGVAGLAKFIDANEGIIQTAFVVSRGDKVIFYLCSLL